MSKLVLNNQIEVFIEPNSSISNINIKFESNDVLLDFVNQLTDENLKRIRFYNDVEELIGEYTNMKFVSYRVEANASEEDTTINSFFSLRAKTSVEIRLEEVEKLLATTNENVVQANVRIDGIETDVAVNKENNMVQDEAIEDLANVISEIVSE